MTLSPCDNDNILSLRLSRDNGDFADFKLPLLKERAATIEANPVLAAHLFDLTVRAVTSTVFGLADESVSLKNMTSSSVGAFGNARAHFGCVECQSRGALHFHCVVWTDLSPLFVSSIVSNSELNAELGRTIDSIICSRLDEIGRQEAAERYHPGNLVRGKVPTEHQYRAATHPVPVEVGPEFEDLVRGSCVDTQCHILHNAGCFKGNKGSKEDRLCRFSMKAVVHNGPPTWTSSVTRSTTL